MTDKPKRRFWQIHLSTAIMLMLVAGAVLWIQIDVIKTYIEKNQEMARVDEILRRLKQGHFQADELAEDGFSDGWEMTNTKGQTFLRSTLRNQAEPIIAIGNNAVPPLSKWVTDDDITIRYIARYSLEQITGIHAGYSYFLKKETIMNNNLAIKFQADLTEWFSKYSSSTSTNDLIVRVGLNGVALAVFALLSEALIRRREGRKT